MLIEEVQLSLANVDLGVLSESAALVLFGNTFCRRIIQGTGLTGIHQIQDVAQQRLYPAKFMTHLRVPSTCLLEEFSVWDQVEVGVDVRSFGRMILDSTFLLARPGEIPPDSEQWPASGYPTLRAGTLFIVEGRRDEPVSSSPRQGHLADLPALSAAPASVAQFGDVQEKGGRLRELDGKLAPPKPIEYTLVAGRDVAWGHAVMFATFTKILDLVEAQFLSAQVFPPFHDVLVHRRQVLERETYYLGNCFAGDRLHIDLRGKLLACPPDVKTRSQELVPAAILELVFEIYHAETHALLVVSRARKLLVVPRTMRTARREAERILYQHGQDR